MECNSTPHEHSSYRSPRKHWSVNTKESKWKGTSREEKYCSPNSKHLRNPLQPILATLNILGRFPYTRDKLGFLQFRLMSMPVAWALLVFCVQAYFVVSFYIWKATHVEAWATFNHCLESIFELIILNTTFHGALATWLDTPNISRAVNRLNLFNRKIQEFVKKPISFKILDHSITGVAFVVIVGFRFMINENHWSSLFIILSCLNYSVCILYFTIILWFWIVFCIMVMETTIVLRHNFLQCTATMLNHDLISTYRSLWVELHSCTLEMTDAMGRTLQLWHVTNFLMSVFSIYGLLVNLIDNDLNMVYVLDAFIHSMINFYVVFTCSHYAKNCMRSDMLVALFSRRWLYVTNSTRSEMELFVDTVETADNCFDILGVFSFNRVDFITTAQTILTYLVIMVQLKVIAGSSL